MFFFFTWLNFGILGVGAVRHTDSDFISSRKVSVVDTHSPNFVIIYFKIFMKTMFCRKMKKILFCVYYMWEFPRHNGNVCILCTDTKGMKGKEEIGTSKFSQLFRSSYLKITIPFSIVVFHREDTERIFHCTM